MRTPPSSNDVTGDVGFDVKYGLTQNLTADFTYNTDFAQVEADEQQVNLTRFSVFFPEKREFFLENQGLFAFGGVAAGGFAAATSDVPILFYSRRIGLNDGQPVPIVAGGRTTGRVGRYSLGLLDIQTGDDSGARSTNFSVVRLKRDLLRRSSIGLLLTGRSVGQSGTGTNGVYGIDGTFGFFDNLNINTYWARSRTDGRIGKGHQLPRPARLRGRPVWCAAGAPRRRRQLQSGSRLRAARRHAPQLRTVPVQPTAEIDPRQCASSPGPARSPTSRTARAISRRASRTANSRSSSRTAIALSVNVTDTYEFLPRRFAIAPDITLPVGGYRYDNVHVQMNLGQRRKLSGNFALDRGTFYNGHKTTISVSRGRMNAGSQLSLEPAYLLNVVDSGGRLVSPVTSSARASPTR